MFTTTFKIRHLKLAMHETRHKCKTFGHSLRFIKQMIMWEFYGEKKLFLELHSKFAFLFTISDLQTLFASV